MHRHALRIGLAGGLCAAIAAMSMRTPGVWHTHVGGDVPHEHRHAVLDHAAGHRHSHSSGRAPHHHGTHHHSHAAGRGAPHSHKHADGDHRHRHADASTAAETRESAAREGTWHVHFAVFGFEWTISSSAPTGRVSSAFPTANHVRLGRGAAPLCVLASPAGLSISSDPATDVARSLSLESGPAPVVVAFATSDQIAPLDVATSIRAGRGASRPPVPPPRPVPCGTSSRMVAMHRVG